MSTESPRVILCVYTTMLKKLIWVIFCLAYHIASPQKSYCSGSLRKLPTTLSLLPRTLPMAQNDCPERASSVILLLSNCVRALAHPIAEHRVSGSH